MSNESKWLTAVGNIVAALAPLLVAYGLLTAEQADLWTALVLAVVAAVVPIAVTSLIRNYNDNETALQVSAMELESARIRAGLRE